jgi:acetylornithine deacetylase/succinyl-diaminopimelate desuccinylase-like protein
MASRLKAAGFADEDIHVLSPAPHKGNLVARLRGTGKRKPILLIASEPSKLNEEMVGAIEKLSNEFWPGAAVIPVMSTGATDGVFLRNAGIPTYGHSGMAMEPATPAHSHRDERAPMKSFYNRNEYLYRLVKMLAGGS